MSRRRSRSGTGVDGLSSTVLDEIVREMACLDEIESSVEEEQLFGLLCDEEHIRDQNLGAHG